MTLFMQLPSQLQSRPKYVQWWPGRNNLDKTANNYINPLALFKLQEPTALSATVVYAQNHCKNLFKKDD